MTRDHRYRITVTGPASLAVELDAPPGVVPLDAASTEKPHVEAAPPTPADLARGARRFSVLVDGWYFEAAAEPARQAGLRERAARAAAAHQPAAGIALRAQIPGRVVRLWVAEGDDVEQGQRLLAVEAMKMENEVRAPHAGRVVNLRVALGELVERNDELLSIS